MFDNMGFLRNFLCPAQAGTFGELAAIDGPNVSQQYIVDGSPAGDVGDWGEPQSYVYNEYIMGWNDAAGRLRGRAGAVRQPSLTFFAADGIHGTPGLEDGQNGGALATYTLYNWINYSPISFTDILNKTVPHLARSPLASDPACFDKKRHQGKMNVAFCDGHVECRSINAGDLQTVYLVAP